VRVFFAAGEANPYWAPGFDDVLVSFASPVVRKRPPTNKLWFLDSGAFSFFQSGADGTKALESYIDFIKTTQHQRYPNLDVIGDGDGTWANDQKMRAAGLDPIGVVHFGEPHELINKYLDAGITKLALGGYAGTGTRVRMAKKWVQACFTHVRDFYTKTGTMPRVHGFGMMDESLLLSFPFYSVDSTVWLISQRYGKIVLWDTERCILDQIAVKDAHKFPAAMRDYGAPLALVDGVVLEDARDLKAAWNIWVCLDVAEFVTSVWRSRGVVWEDEDAWQKSIDAQRKFLLETYPAALKRVRPWQRSSPWLTQGPGSRTTKLPGPTAPVSASS